MIFYVNICFAPVFIGLCCVLSVLRKAGKPIKIKPASPAVIFYACPLLLPVGSWFYYLSSRRLFPSCPALFNSRLFPWACVAVCPAAVPAIYRPPAPGCVLSSARPRLLLYLCGICGAGMDILPRPLVCCCACSCAAVIGLELISAAPAAVGLCTRLLCAFKR